MCCSSIHVCAHAASLTSLYSVSLVLLTVLWKARVFLMPPGTRVYLSGGRICGAVAEAHQTPEAGRLAAFNRMVPGTSSSQGPQLMPTLPPAMRGVVGGWGTLLGGTTAAPLPSQKPRSVHPCAHPLPFWALILPPQCLSHLWLPVSCMTSG